MQVARRSFERAAEEGGSLEVLGCCLTAASGGALLSGAPRSPPPTWQLRPPSGTRILWLFSHAAEQEVRVPGTRAVERKRIRPLPGVRTALRGSL